jgi:hypothetical protein
MPIPDPNDDGVEPIRRMLSDEIGSIRMETYEGVQHTRFVRVIENWDREDEDRQEVCLTPKEARHLYDWLGVALRITVQTTEGR